MKGSPSIVKDEPSIATLIVPELLECSNETSVEVELLDVVGSQHWNQQITSYSNPEYLVSRIEIQKETLAVVTNQKPDNTQRVESSINK